MSKNTLLIIAGVAIVGILVVGKSVISNNSTVDQEKANSVKGTAVTDQQSTAPSTREASQGWYTPYSPDALAAATVDDKKAVIFFHASWCATCKAASEDFQANIDKIPTDVTILKADYDTETELKKKYGVVMQDTFVQVDRTGNELSKWNSGGEGIKTLLANIR